MSLAFDFSDSYTEVQTWTRAQIATLAREWLVHGITQTKGQSVRVKLEDATPTGGTVGTGAGAAWVGVTFNGQQSRGPKRSSGSQRGGGN